MSHTYDTMGAIVIYYTFEADVSDRDPNAGIGRVGSHKLSSTDMNLFGGALRHKVDNMNGLAHVQ